MKNLDAYMKGLYVSLDGINEEAKEKLSNLEGYQITECCGCYDCGCDCENDDCACKDYPHDNEPKCCTTNIVANQFGRFNSESEVIRELDTHPTVRTLIDIHTQFGRFVYQKDEKLLYFGHKDLASTEEYVTRQNGDMPTKEPNLENTEFLCDVATIENSKIYKVVTDIINTFNLCNPVIETKINGEVQVYTVKHTGSNGKENSIKSSLEEVADVLDKLDKKSEIQWSQVLDVFIDNVDDVYGFVITFVLDPEKVRETYKQ